VSIYQEEGFPILVKDLFIVVMSDDGNPDAVAAQLTKIGFALIPISIKAN
jgi:hypothetical protein